MDEIVKSWFKKLKIQESTISMILGALVVVVVGVLIFNYFSKVKKEEEIWPEEVLEEEAGSERPEELPTQHKVKDGEDLWQIAINYYNDGYQWTKIAQANNLTNPNLILVDQELTIPQVEVAQEREPITSEKYTVKKGDCLWFIALRAYGDSYRWSEIAQANQLVNPNLIHPGNELVLPR